jgi:hypothetical protein
MNSATWTKSVVWNVQPRQYKTSVLLLLTFTVNVWGGAVCYMCCGGKGPRDSSWNKWENYISSYVLLALPWLGQLVTGLSSQRSGYDPLPVMAFRVDEVALRKVFCRVVEFTPSLSFNQCSVLCYKLA